jgi:hypothetical protein
MGTRKCFYVNQREENTSMNEVVTDLWLAELVAFVMFEGVLQFINWMSFHAQVWVWRHQLSGTVR